MKKTFVFAGGNSGIGACCARKLAEEGHTVHIWARKAGLTEHIENVIFHEVHIGDETQPLPPAEYEVHGAAYFPGSINLKPFRNLSLQDFRDEYEINLLGAVRFLKHLEMPLRKTGNSSVVLFSSVAAQTGMPFHASTGSAKAAVEGLARNLAAEWAPHVRVNVIAPSLSDTPLAEKLLNTDAKREAATQRHPLKQIGSPYELAQAAAALLKGDWSWCSGQVFALDGGLSSLKIF